MTDLDAAPAAAAGDYGTLFADPGADRIARLNALRAAERADVRGTSEALAKLTAGGLNRLGETARTLAQACEHEVLRRTEAAVHGS